MLTTLVPLLSQFVPPNTFLIYHTNSWPNNTMLNVGFDRPNYNLIFNRSAQTTNLWIGQGEPGTCLVSIIRKTILLIYQHEWSILKMFYWNRIFWVSDPPGQYVHWIALATQVAVATTGCSEAITVSRVWKTHRNRHALHVLQIPPVWRRYSYFVHSRRTHWKCCNITLFKGSLHILENLYRNSQSSCTWLGL